jgi:hypothetical protein
MKRNIFIVIFLLTGLCACKPRKAVAFKEIIVHQQDSALQILVGEGGPEQEKLKCLITKDFKGALRAIDKQELAFNKIIREITSLPEEGVKNGAAVKTAAVAYYTDIKNLQMQDREDIATQEAMHDINPDVARKASDKQIELNKTKLAGFSKSQEKNAALKKALEDFDKVNGL